MSERNFEAAPNTVELIKFDSLVPGDQIVLETMSGSIYALEVEDITEAGIVRVGINRESDHSPRGLIDKWEEIAENGILDLRGSCQAVISRGNRLAPVYETKGVFRVGEHAWLGTGRLDNRDYTLITSKVRQLTVANAA